MKERLTISISSIHGTKHFYIRKCFRHILKGFGYLTAIGLVLVCGVIYYLINEVDFAKSRQSELETQSMSLIEEIASLKSLEKNLEGDLLEREERINLVSDRLGDLEQILGLGMGAVASDINNDTNAQLESRLDAATITSSVRMVMLSQIPNGAPVRNARISSGYGKRVHPITGKTTFHRGLDFAVNIRTPIYAPADGVVEVIRPGNKGAGNFLRLEHAYGFSSSYSHLQKFKVKGGDFVQKGDLIAYSGNTGLSSGPHLHYEVRFVRRPLDPKSFVYWGVDNFETIFNNVRGIRWESLVSKIEFRVSNQLQLSSPMAVQLVDKSS